MNNLDPDVAERWEDLVVYGGTGKAARSWEAYRHDRADARGASATTRPCSSSPESRSACSGPTRTRRACSSPTRPGARMGRLGALQRYEAMGLTMYGQMTAGSWISHRT